MPKNYPQTPSSAPLILKHKLRTRKLRTRGDVNDYALRTSDQRSAISDQRSAIMKMESMSFILLPMLRSLAAESQCFHLVRILRESVVGRRPELEFRCAISRSCGTCATQTRTRVRVFLRALGYGSLYNKVSFSGYFIAFRARYELSSLL